MSTITTRAGKGSPLTNTELDANFTNLNSDKVEKSANLSDLSSAAVARANLGLSAVAATGAYSDLTGTPALFSGSYADLTGKPSLFSGSYLDLTNKPTIPVVPTTVSSFTNDAGYFLPPAFSGNAGKTLVVNSAETGIEYSSSSGGGASTGKAIAMAIVFGG